MLPGSREGRAKATPEDSKLTEVEKSPSSPRGTAPSRHGTAALNFSNPKMPHERPVGCNLLQPQCCSPSTSGAGREKGRRDAATSSTYPLRSVHSEEKGDAYRKAKVGCTHAT